MPVLYFIRVPSADAALGPFEPSETLRKAHLLREKGVEFFITNERGVVVRSEEEISGSRESEQPLQLVTLRCRCVCSV